MKVTLKEEIPRATGSGGGIEIALLIAHTHAGGHVQPVLIARGEKHPRSGLAHGAGKRGAVEHIGNTDAARSELTDHEVRDRLVISLSVVSAFNTGLIGDDDEEVAQCLRMRAELEDARDERKILPAAYIAVVDIDRTVAIQEKSFRHTGRTR